LNDVTAAMTRAKEAAGDKNVLVHGAGTAQLAVAAGVLDELELHVIPVLFGQGRRLFEGLAPEQIELERRPMQECARPIGSEITSSFARATVLRVRPDHGPELRGLGGALVVVSPRSGVAGGT
jgi:dihydrofolate reductase